MTTLSSQRLIKPLHTATKTSACPDGYRKAAVTVDPGKVYHFYREDTPGSWSHKPGNTEVVNVDADGHLIVGPDSANRNYGYLERLGRRHNLSTYRRVGCQLCSS